jgi:hypothetical protein
VHKEPSSHGIDSLAAVIPHTDKIPPNKAGKVSSTSWLICDIVTSGTLDGKKILGTLPMDAKFSGMLDSQVMSKQG